MNSNKNKLSSEIILIFNPSACLGPADAITFFCSFFFFFSTCFGQVLLLRLLFMHCAWTVAAKFDLSNDFQLISVHHALFTDTQISLFHNFFIKNGSHSTIHTFNFQFSAVSKRIPNPNTLVGHWGFFFFFFLFCIGWMK